MKFSAPVFAALVGVALTSSVAASSPEGSSVSVPLRSRRSGSHRNALAASRRDVGADEHPVADLAALERSIAHIEARYAPDQNDPQVLARRDRVINNRRWVSLENIAEGLEGASRQATQNFGGLLEKLVGVDGDAEEQDDTTDATAAASAEATATDAIDEQNVSSVVADEGCDDDEDATAADDEESCDADDDAAEGTDHAVAASSTKSSSKASKKQKQKDVVGGTVSASPLRDILASNRELEFLGEIKIGTPPQSFWIDPDTGSADLWVESKDCQGENCGPASRNRFDASKSSSYKVNNSQQFSIQYGIGAVSGKLATENVAIGPAAVSGMAIGVASTLSSDWATDKADGILGLGFKQIQSAGQVPFIDHLKQQANLKQNVVSFAFGRHTSGTEAKSEMLIGDVNPALNKGDISYYPVTKQGYWQFDLGSLAPGSSKGISGVQGILDTGTSMIAVTSQMAKSFWSSVQGAHLSSDGSFYLFPCSTKLNASIKMPDGRSFPINEKDLNLGKVKAGSKNCVGGVVAASTPDAAIIGLAGLKSVYSVFDFGQNRIGLGTPSF